ncbi:MAG: hypothetical protein GY703_11390, partial [Gammaproteobacteria bacterium]|nr:hypothetical protein [Gammaproteobacteria bacterium]
GDVPELDTVDRLTTGLTTAAVPWSPGSWLTSMSRIDIAEDVLAEVFMDQSISWGFATWSGGSCRANDPVRAPTYYTNYRVGVHAHDADHQDVLQARVDDGSPGGCTPLVPTMRGGLEYFQGLREDGYYTEPYDTTPDCQPRILVVVTDGQGNTATDNARIDAVTDELIAEGVTIVAVGFGLTNANQLDRIVQKMQTAGELSEDDYLYHLHNEDTEGVAVPFMAQNRQEFIDTMNNIVSNVKAQVFHGSSPAATTSVSDDTTGVLVSSAFDASDWSGYLTADQFDSFSATLVGESWDTRTTLAGVTINGFIYDETAESKVSAYTTSSIDGDNYLCKTMGDIINSTPIIVGAPPYAYDFDGYRNFLYNSEVLARDYMVYVGANDGALHAFRLSDGTEKWRFYPDAVKTPMALAETNPVDDMCSSAFCHKFLLDGSPQAADIFVNDTTGWKTILTTGLGRGGSSFFAIDITYGNDFVETTNPGQFLWEFTGTEAAELGLATSDPQIIRVGKLDADAELTETGWITLFGSGPLGNTLLQADKEAYLFALNSWDKE